MGAASRFFSALRGLLRGRPAPSTDAGRAGATATRPIAPPPAKGLVLIYAPERDGTPDGGEIVWTWVPYEENDGRGKDRPVLVIGRHGTDRAYALRLTSKPHDGDPDYVPLGAGEWDAGGRPSWVDLTQLYTVHASGMRREAAALDRRVFSRVAAELRRRHGWRTAR